MEKVNKIFNAFKENKWLHYSIIFLIGIIISIPIFQIQIRETHDGSLHMLRLIGTINCFKIGEFPPLVAPYFCNGGGYAMNLFYNPLVTYVPLLIKLFTTSFALALKLFAMLCIILSGITMYQFVFSVTKKRSIAFFSAVIYILSPYKLGDVYRRYAIGEFASFIFIPILFNGLFNLLNKDGKKHYYIAIGAIGLLLTHTLTTFYMAIFSAVYLLFNFKKLKDKEIIKKILINVIFIILISAFFIMPMLEARFSAKYTIFDSQLMGTNRQYCYENTLELRRLFDDNVFEFKDTIFSIGIPILTLIVLTLFTYKNVESNYKDLYIISILFSIISLFMCTKLCPWFLFPNALCKLQYPWRMLGFFNFFSSFIAGINVYILLKMLLNKDLSRLIAAFILITTMICYTIPIVTQFKTKQPDRDTKYEQRIMSNMYINHMHINRDYLPRKSLSLQRTYLEERDYTKIYILKGYSEIEAEEVVNLTMTAKIQNCEEGTILEFPFFYYPGYRATIEKNGEITKLKCVESNNGFCSVVINENTENANINIEYKGTIITYASYIISFIALIAFIVYLIYCKKRLKEEIK